MKEAFTLLNTLKTLSAKIENHRVDAFSDNMAVVKAWENQGGRDPCLITVLKEIFYFSHKSTMLIFIWCL